MVENVSPSKVQNPVDPLRLALRDLVRDTSTVEALHLYLEGTRWPILPPDGPSSPVRRR
jgi:hypothetical protein